VPRVYAFQDVAEAMLVHELLERGVPHPDIKRTIESLREMYGHDWPLTHARLAVTGSRVVAEPEDHMAYDVGRHGWQQIHVAKEDLQRIVGLLQRGGWAARELPDLQHIEVNPERLSGRPVIRGKRVPVEVVAELAEKPDGHHSLREGYDLTDAEIEDARAWWQATRGFESVAA
jgi:uncharacterized protein (DUF433 family)